MNKKVGVVTGSSKGIGKAIAITFAKSGEYLAVVTNARKRKRLKQCLMKSEL